MSRQEDFLTGVVLGAGLMYLLDPQKGRRRRALLQDQAVHFVSRTDDAAASTARDLGYRAKGIAAEARARVSREEVSDAVLEARVRSEMGRVVSHAGAVTVAAQNGRVTLGGPVLADEVDALLSCVESVRGVQGVSNQLEVHSTPGDVPELQGQGTQREPKFELLQENWAPSTRLLMGLTGGSAALSGSRLRTPIGAVVSAIGLGVLARAITNLPTKRLVGVGAGRRGVEIHKTINVAAPVEDVFAFWSNYENFPRFMSHLREVRVPREGYSHWVAEGPGGIPVAWDAVTTRYVPNELIAWKSVEGSPIASAGIVRFDPNPDGGTRIDIRLAYNPLVGALGHAVAALFGVDPKRAMDEDLVRLKSLLEDGKTTADGATVRREEIAQD